jgi:lipid II:glycine glycyltransferase (peptidoglycan interpeptide bridge formation enzyme)
VAAQHSQGRRNDVQVTIAGRSAAAFHELYRVTAERDRFTGRPLSYFQKMYDALASKLGPDRLYLAQHEGETLAATLDPGR